MIMLTADLLYRPTADITKCKKLGIKPDLIIGDFDSSDVPDTDIKTIILPVRKDDTDTFFAVKYAIKQGFNVCYFGWYRQ